MTAQTGAMDFFRYQDEARRKSSLLVFYYFLAVILIIVAVYLACALVFAGYSAHQGSEPDVSHLWHPELFLWVAGISIAIVAVGSLVKIAQMSGGGEMVARMLGGRPVNSDTRDINERKILNVVEEMAIASGMAVPRVFIMDNEEQINAFAAGFTAKDAVIGVTRGCIVKLTRDELQGVIAHEFSHILNGDMRLNIRLIGVLNGILIIGMIGYWMLRVALRSGSSRGSKKGGNTLPFALLGLLIMIIGYVGVFFGKLIKAAVSRQREYLADASAVQFTRNPAGIGNALKKIGGVGSRIEDSHAEEASHFYFANGLSSAFLNLFATHPPITERIRRIDPAFSGDFSKLVQSRETGQEADGGVSAFAGTGRFAASSESILADVGAPSSEHLQYAASVIANIPQALADAVHSPTGAELVIYALLLNAETGSRERQLAAIGRLDGDDPVGKVTEFAALLQRISADYRLPLAWLSISGLKAMAKDRFPKFKDTINQLVNADEETDLFEYTMQRMILRNVEPGFTKVHAPSVQYHDVKSVYKPCAELLSCLACWGADDIAGAEKAFMAGVSRIFPGRALAMNKPEECGLAMLDRALNQIGLSSHLVRKSVLDACIACIGSDGMITAEEAELIRAVGDSFDCPIPPFLPGKIARAA